MINPLRLILGVLVVLLALNANDLAPRAYAFEQPEGQSGLAPKPLVTAKKYMVVAAHPLAAEAGLAMLRKGGSAIDAAIATQMVLNLVEPQSSGIGGGAFMLYWDAAPRRSRAMTAARPRLPRPRPNSSSMTRASRCRATLPCPAACRSAFPACSPR